jgi:hypothetical protein
MVRGGNSCKFIWPDRSITVETDRTDYVTGDTVRVFGTIKFDIIIDVGVESPKP